MPLPDAEKYVWQALTLPNTQAGERDWIPADPSRVCLVVGTDGIGFAFTLRVRVGGAAPIAIQVAAGDFREFLWGREGPLCQLAFTGDGNGTGGNMVAYSLSWRG